MSPPQKIRWHMKMIAYNHFLCHFLLLFFCVLFKIQSAQTRRSGKSLMISSDSVSKIISCRFNRPIPDLVNHQYGIISRMYSEENPQNFRFPVPCLYPRERVMLLLGTETAFKLGGPLP